MTVLGAVTIGQSPRDELAAELKRLLPDDATIVQTGALDGIDESTLASLRPRAAASTLTTALGDGRSVRVDHDLLAPLVESAIARAERAGAGATLLMCTGEFRPLAHSVPFLHAHQLLANGVAALAAGMTRVGVIAPLPEQRASAAASWTRTLGVEVCTRAADPYRADAAATIAAAARGLAGNGVDLIVLDCIGYRESSRAAAMCAGVPVVLSRAVVGRLTAELLAGLPQT